MGLRAPPNLPAEFAESLQACAATWTNDEDFDLARYRTAAAAMDAYAAFHASALRSGKGCSSCPISMAWATGCAR
jgi:hypothetical protein